MSEKTIYTKMRDGKKAEYEVVREEAGGVMIMRNTDNPHNAEFKSSKEKLEQGGYVLKSSAATSEASTEVAAQGKTPAAIVEEAKDEIKTETDASENVAVATEPATANESAVEVKTKTTETSAAVVTEAPAEPVAAEAPKKRTRAGSASKNRITCEYFIIRFMPSAEREERVNVGIAITSDDRYDVRFAGMAKAEALAPGYDLKAWKRDQAAWHQALSGTFAAANEADYEAKVDALLTKYVL